MLGWVLDLYCRYWVPTIQVTLHPINISMHVDGQFQGVMVGLYKQWGLDGIRVAEPLYIVHREVEII